MHDCACVYIIIMLYLFTLLYNSMSEQSITQISHKPGT